MAVVSFEGDWRLQEHRLVAVFCPFKILHLVLFLITRFLLNRGKKEGVRLFFYVPVLGSSLIIENLS